MRVAYLDCASGISGDMTLGALVDAGVSLDRIQAGLDSLGLPDCRLEVEEVRRKGFRATKMHVRHQPEHAHRHLHHITDMIDGSNLTPAQRALATRIFTRLGEAEALVHGTTLQKVHFHEVGAVDSIADIVGSAIAWDLLGVDRVVCSPIPTGQGFIQIAHGRVRVPAPATAELLRGIPLAASEIEAELTTPTGAAIVAEMAHSFGNLPAMTVECIGCGAGDRDFDSHPNVLRVFVGRTVDTAVSEGLEQDTICVLETNLDDTTPEVIGHTLDQLLGAAALDAFTAPIQMKKGRPAVLLTVLCRPHDRQRLESILFRETTTLGIRHAHYQRSVLPRQQRSFPTAYGVVDGMWVMLPTGEARFAPEYETCRALALQHQVPLQEVMQAARNVAGSTPASDG